MSAPSPVEVLTQARAHLKRGWTPQGDSTIGSALHSAEPDLSRRMQVRRLLQSLLPDGQTSIGDWNDAPGRTQEEVLALMDRALDLARQKEAGGDV